MKIFTAARLEVLATYFVQGMASIYWVLAAIVLPIETYGKMMLVYAAVTFISNILRIRSFDLFFWLLRSREATTDIAFLRTFYYEFSMFLLLVAGAAIVHFSTLGLLFPDKVGPIFGIFVLYSLGNMAGSAIAILREEDAKDVLIMGNLTSGFLWIVATVTLFTFRDLQPNEII